ncbi:MULTISPECIES: peptidoglycan-binding protein [unclassified Streptomyces]|uniref:peptidoglycan-binding protein n=1 Tax=unclassified Streptomyces TaxID=2593676 RepID=UPI0004C01780|nr:MULTISPECIES: peptidoglycan-binding protein [unclassified Streptomyces]
MSIEKLLSVAKAEVGTREKFAGGHWVNDSKYNRWFGRIPGYSQNGYGWPWCAAFVSWVAHEAGHADLYPHTASCAIGVSWFKNRGRFSEYPAVGAQIFFGSGGGAHTGLVYAYDETYVYTYEGNTNASGGAEGDGVYAKKRVRRDAYVYGYGYPAVSGSLSADPNAARFGYKHAKTSEAAKPAAKPSSPSKPKAYAPFPGADFFKREPKSPLITAMGKRLVAEGCSAYKDGPGPQWTDADKASYAKWQRKRGYTGADADGWPGKTTWDALKVPKV